MSKGKKRRTSAALVELRTVASRAETALDVIKGLTRERASCRATGDDVASRHGPPFGQDMQQLTGYWARYAEDPEEPEMITALEQVVALLARWR